MKGMVGEHAEYEVRDAVEGSECPSIITTVKSRRQGSEREDVMT